MGALHFEYAPGKKQIPVADSVVGNLYRVAGNTTNKLYMRVTPDNPPQGDGVRRFVHLATGTITGILTTALLIEVEATIVIKD